MSWYRHAQQGEWWIIDGNAMFADGNVGDQNHETYVIDHVRRQFATDPFDYGEYVDWDGFKRHLAKVNLDKRIRNAPPAKVEKLKEQFAGYDGDDPEFYTPELKALGMTYEEMLIADGKTGQVDIRRYGMKKLGWKRVAGKFVETFNLTAQDLQQISEGLYEAYSFDVEDDAAMDQMTFTIEVASNRLTFRDIPYSVIRTNNVQELIAYGRKPSVFASTNWYRTSQNLNAPWYHGSVQNFTQFKPYSWFTNNKELASTYISWETAGRPAEILYTVSLSVSNPLDLSGYDMDERISEDVAGELLTDMGISLSNSDALKEWLTRPNVEEVSTSWVVNKDMRKITGHDSILIPESGVQTICIFNPADVKILRMD